MSFICLLGLAICVICKHWYFCPTCLGFHGFIPIHNFKLELIKSDIQWVWSWPLVLDTYQAPFTCQLPLQMLLRVCYFYFCSPMTLLWSISPGSQALVKVLFQETIGYVEPRCCQTFVLKYCHLKNTAFLSWPLP